MKKQMIWTFCCLLVSSHSFPQTSMAVLPTDCDAYRTAAEEQGNLSLDYDAFDQTPGQGWRQLAEKECYREAAELIIRYLNTNTTLRGNEREILSFHAGQMFAYSDDYESAIPFFEQSFSRLEGIPPEFKPYADAWDAYVNATIAFLKQDKAALVAYRAVVAEGPTLDNGEVMNLSVVDRLIERFGQPYRQAYGG